MLVELGLQDLVLDRRQNAITAYSLTISRTATARLCWRGLVS